ncbi:MAG: SGNH/GDSL hydrolase family protein [Ginsengibacter sp.]
MTFILKQIVFLLLVLFSFQFLQAQKKEPVWDNTAYKHWDEGFTKVQMKSTADGAIQNARFHKTSSKKPQPLIVSLHTWSGNYDQGDPLAAEVLLRDWNYIHPDFRGPNNNPDACGSALAIHDLLDAIHYAIKNGNVDTTNVHIVGVSGGAYLTLLAYMKLDYPVKSFDAWAPISDLTKWYWESKGRHNVYAKEVAEVASKNGKIDWSELKKRSPMYLPFPYAKRRNSELHIYEGVHDGYTGSVPITHSILFYNKIAKALYPHKKNAVIPDSTWMSILIKQCDPSADSTKQIGGRLIQLQKCFPKLSLTLFEGTHEMLVPPALALLPINEIKNTSHLNVITIGDSNGAFKFGWPQQLMKLLRYSKVVNHSIAGNTIGFDNLGRKDLNTLRNIDDYLKDACEKLGKNQHPDYLFIDLGTNDTKQIFKDRQPEVAQNYNTLLNKITDWFQLHHIQQPKICVITPSPMDEQMIDTAKYGGGDERIRANNIAFKKVAEQHHVDFLDTYDQLKNNFSGKTIDGVHLKPKVQFEMATLLVSYINKNSKR